MKSYLIEPKYQRFVKGYGFLSFANNANKKRLDYNKQSARDELKIEKGATQNQQKQLVVWLVTKLLINYKCFENSTTE